MKRNSSTPCDWARAWTLYDTLTRVMGHGYHNAAVSATIFQSDCQNRLIMGRCYQQNTEAECFYPVFTTLS